MKKLIILLVVICSSISGFTRDNPGGYQVFQSVTGRDYYYDEPEEGIIRILTYNIRNCIGMDGKTDFEPVASDHLPVFVDIIIEKR